MTEERLAISEFRAVCAGVGPLAAALLAEEFAPFKVDAARVAGSATVSFARDLADTNANFAIIPFDLGYPHDVQAEQQDCFARMTELLGKEGVETLALITVSAFVPEGDYRVAEWAARLPSGGAVRHAKTSGRIAACLASAAWEARLMKEIDSALETGAGGVFLDAVCFGAAPVLIGEKFAGPVGCHCPACREAFAGAGGGRIPPGLARMEDEDTRKYIDWRAGVVTALLKKVAAYLKEKDDDALLAVNAPHAATLPAKPMFGVDVPRVAEIADVLCMEHCHAPMLKRSGLTYEAPSLKALRTAGGRALPASLGYAYGPAPDAVHAPKYYSFTLANGYACGVAPVARFGEYRDRPSEKDKEDQLCDYMDGAGRSDQRDVMAAMHNWMEKNPDVYEGAEPAARVGILYSWEHAAGPGGARMLRYHYTLAQTLTELQVPVKTLTPQMLACGAAEDVRVVISPITGSQPRELQDWAAGAGADRQFVFIGNTPDGIPADRMSVIPEDIFAEKRTPFGAFLHSNMGARLLGRLYGGMPGIYGGFPLSRRAGLPPLLLNRTPSAFMRCAPPERWKELRETVSAALGKFQPDVTIEAPPYIHVMETRKAPDAFFHVVNIAPGFPGPDACALRFPGGVSGRVLTPGGNKIVYLNNESSIVLKPDPYIVVHVKNRY